MKEASNRWSTNIGKSHILQEALIKSLNREAVATQSPGLPGFGGYPGKGPDKRFNPEGVAPNLASHR